MKVVKRGDRKMGKEKEKEKKEIKFSKGFTDVVEKVEQREGVFLYLSTEKNAKGDKVFVPTLKIRNEEVEKLFGTHTGVAIGIKKEKDKDTIEIVPTDANYIRKVIKESGSVLIVIRKFLEKIGIDQYKLGEMIELKWEVSGNSLFVELPEGVRAK